MSTGSRLAVVAITLLVIAGLAVALAPVALPDSYSWMRHSVSESAAQQTPGAWVGRLGLLLSGIGTLAVCVVRSASWRPVTTISIAAFGAMWTLTAVYSTRSWLPGVPYDPTEDALHSAFATGMAVIVIGGLARAFTARNLTIRWRVATLGLVVAATLLPLGSLLVPEASGVLQRVMFLAAYAWLAREAAFALRTSGRDP